MKKLMTALGLAALAALALSAFVAPTSAFAVSALCSNGATGAHCAGGGGATDNELTVGATIIAKSETPNVVRLTSGFVNVTCGWSEVELTLTGNTPPTGKITKLTFTDCHSNLNTTSGSCTASTTASSTNGWPTTATTTGAGPNGKMEVENVKGEFTCNIFGSNTKCIYGAAKAGNGHSTGEEIAVLGGEPAHVEAKHVELNKEAGSASSCSTHGIWEGNYTVTSPASLYLT